MLSRRRGTLLSGGEDMDEPIVKKRRKKTAWPDDRLRLDPENRLCSEWDAVTIREFPVADREEMGVRVLDNFCQEHIM